MQIIIKPVPSQKWHGKNGKDSFARPQTIEALYDTQTGRYATGLTEEEAKKYGKLLGVDLDDTFNFNEPHPFWSSSAVRIKLPNHTMILDDTRHLDFVKIKVLKASKFIANSLQEWEDGMFPDATHIIYDEQEETEVKATKIEKKNKCIVVASKMSAEEKTNIVRLLSDKSVRGRTQSFIDLEIDGIINDSDKIDDFIKYVKMDKAEVTIRAQIMEALSRNVLTKEGTAIHYMGEPLGHDFEATVKYFQDPNHQQTKIAMLEKLEK